jgi:4-hydroxy-tetrahydrodipicolinate synthase
MAIGGTGTMNAVSNIDPERVAAMCEAVARGDLAEARKLHFELFELNQLIFLDTNPIPLKYMMMRLGLLETPEVRLPLVPLDAERGLILDGALRRAGLL